MDIKNSIVVLQPGMYVLRHPSGAQPPLTVTRAPAEPGSTGTLELVATKNTYGSILRDGADCIVMHVMDAPVELLVSAYLADASAPVPSLRIDRIGLAAAPAPQAAAIQAPAPRQIEISARGMSLIGHVERTGDVVAAEGQRVGEPSSNLRVEGFQVMWPDRPAGVDLAYSIAVEGLGATPIVTSGKFCGTRGQARRITEVTFALTGPQAEQFGLDGTAYFTGGFQVPITSGMAVSGPSGLEHLTALSLRAVPAKALPKKATNPWDESPHTKVFKAKPIAPKAKPAIPKTKAAAPKAKSAVPKAKAIAAKPPAKSKSAGVKKSAVKTK